jgi:Pyruvate/2-oxoacid:ferredoxin oxidoreductase delta subunit
MVKNKKLELRILKAILWVYIILCIVIAGLNYGYVSRATPSAAAFITSLWHFYENWVKTIFVIIGSFLTLRIVGDSNRTKMRKRNLQGLIISALVVHIAGPIFLHNKELYFFTMPLPWSTTPLQLLYPGSSIYFSRYPIWGAAGISAALVFYICFSFIIFVGTLLFGRRLQCSTLCLFNGFASEVFSPAFPLTGKKRNISNKVLRAFKVIRWVFLSLSVFFTAWWILFISGANVLGDAYVMGRIESYKYLSTELLMAMFFWVAFIGRGYCYYCPLGTVLSLLSKIAGQKIITNKSNCIGCNQCSIHCPMTIDIRAMAQNGESVSNSRCVGCGHCVDICPTETLGYSTRFLDWMHNKLKKALTE